MSILQHRARQLNSLMILADGLVGGGNEGFRSSNVAKTFRDASGDVDKAGIIVEALAIYEAYQDLKKEYGRLVMIGRCHEMIEPRTQALMVGAYWEDDPGFIRIDSILANTLHNGTPMCR